MSVPLIVLGAGGHARECAWMASQSRDATPFEVVAFAITDRIEGATVGGIPVRSLEEAARLYPTARFIAGVGSASARRALTAHAESLGLRAATVVHRTALVAPDAELAEGVVLFASTVVSVSSRLGRHTHMNFGSSVSHDVTIGEYSTLSPGARVAGNVQVGGGVFLGIGASVLHGRAGAPLRIGDDTIIGAGACVIRDVAVGETVAGVPARRLRRASEGADR